MHEPSAVASEAGRARAHESAQLHVRGQACFTDDIAELAGTLHAALGWSMRAHARIVALDLAPVKASRGVVAVLCAQDIPGLNDCGPIIHDDPILADGVVHYWGQPIFIVVADSHEAARRAARLAKIEYADLPAILSAREARAQNAYVLPPMQLNRGDAATALKDAPHRVQGELSVGGQEQFYLEGQIAYAIPGEQQSLKVYSSTQHPSEMQQVVAHALGLASHQVQVECRRMGGGFGGKESQSALWAAAASLAARHCQRPVKLRADRDDDMLVTGKRHCFDYQYEVGYDASGRILGARIDMVSRAGFSADLSGPVATRAVCHVDNTYYLSAVEIRAACGKTNTQSNTAFRGFGGPQGAFVIEYAIDEIARALGRDPLDIRCLNFYDDEHRLTPYGQSVEDNVIAPLVAQLEASSDYRARRREAERFNAGSPVLKRGIALTPVKFGIAFNVTHLNQAGALVHVYADGSILVNHGGTEMGQGIHTKVMQAVAHEFGVDLAHIRITATDTAKVANTSATAASTGADLNGQAAQDAARSIRARLSEFAARTWGGTPEQVVYRAGQVSVGATVLSFEELVAKAYLARVQLFSSGFYATPGLSWDAATMQGRPFAYFAYGAAVAQVLVDSLTGEWTLERADLLYDAGRSINPALDIGQVEGAFIQGMGWLTTEELRWNDQGRLLTHAPSTYKIPTVSDCPPDLRVALFDNVNHAPGLLGAKAVGEPPLLLAFSVFFAIRDAISACGPAGVQPPLQSPATSEEILNAITKVRAGAR